MKLLPRRNCDSHAFFKSHRSEIRSPGPCKYDDFHRTLRRMHTETAAAEVAKRTQVTAFEFMHANQFFDCFSQLHRAVRYFETINTRGSVKPLEVCIETEDCRPSIGCVTPNPLENATAVVQRVGRHVRGGVFPTNDFAVTPNPLGLIEAHVI